MARDDIARKRLTWQSCQSASDKWTPRLSRGVRADWPFGFAQSDGTTGFVLPVGLVAVGLVLVGLAAVGLVVVGLVLGGLERAGFCRVGSGITDTLAGVGIVVESTVVDDEGMLVS